MSLKLVSNGLGLFGCRFEKGRLEHWTIRPELFLVPTHESKPLHPDL